MEELTREELLELNRKLLLENAKILHSNTELRRERDRLNYLMYELLRLLHSCGIKEDADSL